MSQDDSFLQAIQQTRILRPPKHLLATFGTTSLQYLLLSPMPDNPAVCRLREGHVTAQRPQILTPDVWKQRFEGFGEEAAGFEEQIEKIYGAALRSLEYTFRNELQTTSLEHTSPPELADRTHRRLEEENSPRKALIQGPDQTWSLSIMKFIVEMSLRSFPSNVRELDERGMFDPGAREDRNQRMETERRFRAAEQNPSEVKRLGEFLHRNGLFREYEDRFFALVQR